MTSATLSDTSPFARIGGATTVDRLVDAFYDNMETLPEAQAIRAMHAQDLGPTRAILKVYLAEWLGGPREYSAQKGHPRLRMRHMHLSIGPQERDAWLLCMSQALATTVPDVEMREHLYQNLAKLADWMRNDPDNAHDKGHR
ncbi:group II truncated hemoglobin [Methylocystis sp. 9N]|uniref:Group II truncated hemoglobin n=1 Tax=Methylocystis borbori TaxID=3118750 RepID=A0ABU7XCE9_9HYPH